MNEHDPLDLTPLDPLEDPAGWQAFVADTMARVDFVLAPRTADPLVMIASWRRPLLIAAAAAVALLLPVELALEAREVEATQVERLVSFSARWSPAEGPPSGGEFLRVLTAEDGR